MTEHRIFRNMEIRAAEDTGPNGRPVVSLRIITPKVVDTYGSMWNPITFDQRLDRRMKADPHDTPTLAWAHKWDDPIGHGIGHKADPGGPFVDFELDDFDAVPRAKQAHAQVISKTIRDCSVGFSNAERRNPTEEETRDFPGVKEIIDAADLDEVSLVLRGAVPGAKVVDVRMPGSGLSVIRQVPEELVITLGKKIAAGEMTYEEAMATVNLSAGVAPEPAAGTKPDEQQPEAKDLSDLFAEADALIDQ